MAADDGGVTPLAAAAAAAAAAAVTVNVDASAGENAADSDAAATGTMTVKIKSLNGPDFELVVDGDELVSVLKTKVRQRTNVDEARQRLIYRGKVLADAELLSAYKVENGHFVHMVARPEGVLPPVAAVAAPPESRPPYYSAIGDPGVDLRTAEGLIERILNEPAMPANSVITGAEREQGRNGSENVLLSHADQLEEERNLMSNLLGLQRDGGGGGVRGARRAEASPQVSPQWSANSHADGILGRRGPRRIYGGAARPAGSSSGSGFDSGGGMAAGSGHTRVEQQQQQHGAGGGVDGHSANLEHVRQGLLTLHTLLSGTASRRRRELLESSSSDEVVAHSAEPTSTAPAQGEFHTEEYYRRVAAATAASAAATPTVGARSMAAEMGVESQPKKVERRPLAHKKRQDRKAGVEVGSSYDSRLSDGSGGGGSGGGGSRASRAWMPAASFDEGSEEGDKEEDVVEVDKGDDKDKVQGTGGEHDGRQGRTGSESRSGVRPSLSWPLPMQDGAPESPKPESGLESVSGSESESSEDIPRLQSESGDSSDGGDDDEQESWGDRHALSGGWSPGFLRGPRTPMEGGGGREESKEDESSPSDRPRQLRRRFFVGQWLDVKDTVNNWLEATVMDMTSSGSRLQIHYNGWPPRWDEWLSWDSPRIAPFRTRTQHLPQAQHVSPAPVSAVRNAPRTGPLVDDVRVVVPEVSRVLQEIGPMVDELSSCYAQQLEKDPSTSPTDGRAVSHILPWTRQRVQLRQQGNAAADDLCRRCKATDLAGDIAPLLDRLGRMLTDVAPHLARLSTMADDTAAPAAAAARGAQGEDVAEPGELSWQSLGLRTNLQGDGGARRSSRDSPRARQEDLSYPEDTTYAFRQLVSTSSPAPTSSNINIHIHAIVPMRGPPSPPPPPPPPPPTASASAVATPTRAERPPLASVSSAGSNRNSNTTNSNRPWNGNDSMNTFMVAARAAAASRAESPSARRGGDAGSVSESGGGGSSSGRSPFLASSFLTPSEPTRQASPLTVSAPGSLLLRSARSVSNSSVGSEAARPAPSFSEGGAAGGPGASDTAASESASGSASGSARGHWGEQGHEHRRGGPWRGLLRVLGVGRNVGGSRQQQG